jgi:AcrR family transcriptional regulator
MGTEERKKREFQRREREIIDAAIELFAQGDWMSITIDQIAEKAEVGKGTVYKHFKSKDEIYTRIIINNSRALYWKLKKIKSVLEFEEKFRQLFKTIWNFYMDDYDFMLKLMQYCEQRGCLCSMDTFLQEEFTAAEKANLSVYKEILEDGINSGYIPEQNLSQMVFAGISMIYGIIRNVINRGLHLQLTDVELDQLVEYSIGFTLRGWGYRGVIRNEI